jgi:diguanylate cyclase (GGDEF)-like protein
LARFCREAPSTDARLQWLRQLIGAVEGWGRGELDSPLPGTDDTAGLPSELVELRAVLELTRQVWRAERAQQVMAPSLHDGLTGFPNRALFTSLVRRMVARLARHGGSTTLLLLDLDDFRNVNNELGHEAGDQLLVAVARRLASSVRAEDAVARLDGDEFAMLLEGTDMAGAQVLAERVLASFAMPFTVHGHEVLVTASIGLTAVEPDVEDAAELIRRGDVALHVAKRAGKATSTTFQPHMDDARRGRLRLESDLRQAADRGELRLHYQPVFGLPSGAVVGIEALLRWEHPTRGLLAPGAFIGVAEETGLIVAVGEWVLEEAATERMRLRSRLDGAPGARGVPDGAGVPVQVNVSARQFRDPDFLGVVAGHLVRCGIPPGDFGIEITESVMAEETERTVALLTELKNLGTVISVDDFGIGYSSLTYLRRFPVDVLKLDRSFIEHIADEVESRAVVKAVIQLGHDLGLTVVAEGVEDEDQLRWLQNWGCDAAQGFLLARPMPADQLHDFLRRRVTAPFVVEDG